MPSPTAALALCRAVGDGALMLAFGAGLFATAAVPPVLRRDATLRAGRLAARAAPIALLAVLLRLPAQAAALGEGWGDALDAGTLLAVATGTAVGRAWAVNCGATLLVAAAVALRPKASPVRSAVPWNAFLWTIAAGSALASLALSGHAAALAGAGGVAVPVLALHILAGGAWIGSLPEVLGLMATLRREPGAEAAARALRRFSAAGHGVVALLIASGTLDAALIAGWPGACEQAPASALACLADSLTHAGDPIGTAYGQVLLLKVLLAAAMAGLALVNRYRLVPRLAADRDAARRLLAHTRWVLALGLAAVAASGLLGLLDPP